jgi:hypothetical protein
VRYEKRRAKLQLVTVPLCAIVTRTHQVMMRQHGPSSSVTSAFKERSMWYRMREKVPWCKITLAATWWVSSQTPS